jgi:hypothetical protein
MLSCLLVKFATVRSGLLEWLSFLFVILIVFACLDRDKASALDQRAAFVRGDDAQADALTVGRIVEILWYAIV